MKFLGIHELASRRYTEFMATIPKKKPRNQMALAKLIADIATGEVAGTELTLKEAKSLAPNQQETPDDQSRVGASNRDSR